jgi:hypothetical protein
VQVSTRNDFGDLQKRARSTMMLASGARAKGKKENSLNIPETREKTATNKSRILATFARHSLRRFIARMGRHRRSFGLERGPGLGGRSTRAIADATARMTTGAPWRHRRPLASLSEIPPAQQVLARCAADETLQP